MGPYDPEPHMDAMIEEMTLEAAYTYQTGNWDWQ